MGVFFFFVLWNQVLCHLFSRSWFYVSFFFFFFPINMTSSWAFELCLHLFWTQHLFSCHPSHHITQPLPSMIFLCLCTRYNSVFLYLMVAQAFFLTFNLFSYRSVWSTAWFIVWGIAWAEVELYISSHTISLHLFPEVDFLVLLGSHHSCFSFCDLFILVCHICTVHSLNDPSIASLESGFQGDHGKWLWVNLFPVNWSLRFQLLWICNLRPAWNCCNQDKYADNG